MSFEPMSGRPATVVMVAAFFWLATVIAAVVGAILIFPGTPLDRIWQLNPPAQVAFHAMGRVAGPLLWLVGCATAAVAVGMTRQRRWAWRLAIALFAINGMGDLVSLFVTGDLLKSAAGVAIAGAFLLLLFRPKVKIYFAE